MTSPVSKQCQDRIVLLRKPREILMTVIIVILGEVNRRIKDWMTSIQIATLHTRLRGVIILLSFKATQMKAHPFIQKGSILLIYQGKKWRLTKIFFEFIFWLAGLKLLFKILYCQRKWRETISNNRYQHQVLNDSSKIKKILDRTNYTLIKQCIEILVIKYNAD